MIRTGYNLDIISFNLLRYLEVNLLPYGLSCGAGFGFGAGAAETDAREAAPKRMSSVVFILQDELGLK